MFFSHTHYHCISGHNFNTSFIHLQGLADRQKKELMRQLMLYLPQPSSSHAVKISCTSPWSEISDVHVIPTYGDESHRCVHLKRVKTWWGPCDFIYVKSHRVGKGTIFTSNITTLFTQQCNYKNELPSSLVCFIWSCIQGTCLSTEIVKQVHLLCT